MFRASMSKVWAVTPLLTRLIVTSLLAGIVSAFGSNFMSARSIVCAAVAPLAAGLAAGVAATAGLAAGGDAGAGLALAGDATGAPPVATTCRVPTMPACL